jgi:hypothetical protein
MLRVGVEMLHRSRSKKIAGMSFVEKRPSTTERFALRNIVFKHTWYRIYRSRRPSWFAWSSLRYLEMNEVVVVNLSLVSQVEFGNVLSLARVKP